MLIRMTKTEETLVRLNEKYKEKHRVINAQKQKRKHQSKVAALVPQPSGNEIVDPQPSVIEATDYDVRKEIIAQRSSRDVTNCVQCEIKDTRLRELEDVVRKTIQIAPANLSVCS